MTVHQPDFRKALPSSHHTCKMGARLSLTLTQLPPAPGRQPCPADATRAEGLRHAVLQGKRAEHDAVLCQSRLTSELLFSRL